MMLPSRPDQTPHLAIFLKKREDADRQLNLPPATWAMAAIVFVAGLLLGRYVGGWAMALTMGLGLPASYLLFRKPPAPEDEVTQEARTVCKKLRKSIELKRIYKDLDDASLVLIEESARNWHRVQQALSGPAWSQNQLPASLMAIRRQCLAAADQAMNEIMVLYAPFLPETIENKGFLDYAQDLAEGVFGAKRPVRPLPSAFEPARQIAEKLKLLAAEVERRSEDPAGKLEASSGLSLDLALSELKQLDAAEEELRQNLGA